MTKKKIFIFAYYSLYDPVFQSAGLPYFEKLGVDGEFEFILLTFEQKKYYPATRKERDLIKNRLKENNIIWYHTKWHSGRFMLFKKVFSFLLGVFFSGFLILKYRTRAIYAEGVLGGVFGYYLSILFGIPLIVHSYEPHADYMIESNVWTKDYWGARLLKFHEYKIGMHARYILTGTQSMIDRLAGWKSKTTARRVPSCVDTDLFKPLPIEAVQIRTAIGIPTDAIVITYLGKFGGMYYDEEVFDFFYEIHQTANFKSFFMILTPDDHEKIKQSFQARGISTSSFFITTLKKEAVPGYLSASDFGLVIMRQTPSKIFTSPIKNGEYWACAVPIVIFKGISSDYITAEQKEIGIVIDEPSTKAYHHVIATMNNWVADKSKLKQIKQNCLHFALEDRSLGNYIQLYKEVFRDC